MKVVITGKGGQLAWELERLAPDSATVVCLGIEDLDITEQQAVEEKILSERPDVVINAAAYTAVDKAEADTALAYAVNESGARFLAEACRQFGARLLHVSTDFVFDGEKNTPYQTIDTPNPINVYGASKLAGDKAVQETLDDQAVIVRTAWVYSVNGNNFVKTMLKLMAEKPHMGIVYDQVGSPTWAKGLAEWLWKVALNPNIQGVYHWTDGGVASWYDFAVAIQELGLEKGLLSDAIPLRPIPASAYPTPARRPSFSVIDKTTAEDAVGLETIHWRKQLSSMMDELLSKP
ncbi:dTDP-4-dehydrorhamnose reductase [Corallincola luteus]|uniref:dTDP-4-dehydrorhamnose reductase n=1 Tax=Corallincola luteus TaxID=1775177 RepID=A0ABY2ASV6_9GAMM|nr:dTDP-4-dehydrorhamnose reductase [Corallincola luteus]TCI05436.1 dTDP-4-dehydrorhamnose reductase [Corallincola luteus]